MIQDAKENEKMKSRTNEVQQNPSTAATRRGLPNESLSNNIPTANFTSFSRAAKPLSIYRASKPKTRSIGTQTLFKSVGTQTEDTEDNDVAVQPIQPHQHDKENCENIHADDEKEISQKIETILGDFLKSLMSSLSETLCLNIHKETIINRRKLIHSCFKHHFSKIGPFSSDSGLSSSSAVNTGEPAELTLAPTISSINSGAPNSKRIKSARKSRKKKTL
jgi:hypothetical protein